MQQVNRRNFLKCLGVVSAGAGVLSSSNTLESICVLTDTSVFAVGNQGVILKRNA